MMIKALELQAKAGMNRKPRPVPATAAQRESMLNFIAPQAQPRWMGPGVAFYTPARVEQIFRQALGGDLQSQWEMFDLMEATAPRLAKNLNQLKDDVISAGLKMKPFAVDGAKPSEEAKRRARIVDEIMRSMPGDAKKDENDFEDTQRDLMDARGKGHSVLETSWDYREISTGVAYAPHGTRYVHPAWYGYERGAGDGILRLKSQQFAEYTAGVSSGPTAWMDFPDHKFVVGICKNKSGHPLGSALLHTLGFWWAAANCSGEWFLNLAQIFGQPFRWATYDPNMTPGDQASLARWLANMGSQAYAMFPAGTQLELKESIKNSGDAPQMVLINYFDKLCDMVILRQTLTSDVSEGGGNRALGEVHERGLGKVELAVSSWLCKTLQQLVNSICLLNFGDLKECPSLAPPIDDEEDPGELATMIQTLSQGGLEPTDAALPDLSTRLGFEIQRKVEPSPDNTPAPKAELKAKAAIPAAGDQVDEIAARHAPAVAEKMRANFAPVIQIIRDSKSPAECDARIKAYFADWRPAQLVSAIEPALQECAAAAPAPK